MRGFYIDVHNSCSNTAENANYNYIISFSLTLFWNQICSIGNIYYPQYRWSEACLNAFSEMEKWLSSHNKEDSPAVLLGDFNMPFEKLKKYTIKKFPDWTIANLTGNSITYSKGSKSSCIDYIIYNNALIPHVYLSSACSFVNDISDHYPIFLSCNKNLSDGFNKPMKIFKWSKHICIT